jgi:tetratricopeptide (TPR) repeat protein
MALDEFMGWFQEAPRGVVRLQSSDCGVPGSRNRTRPVRKALGPDHPSMAAALNNLAGLLEAKGDYARAEPLYRRALAINEKTLRPDHRPPFSYRGLSFGFGSDYR